MPIVTALVLATLLQQGTPPPPVQAKTPEPLKIEIATSVTHHTINLPTGAVTYTATAGQIPLRSETGEIECRMFCATYTKDGADAKSRPVTFAFNGGPGSATIWLHMGTIGPKRAPMNDDGTLPKPPYEAVDNLESWLDFSDVVLVDAPGTGYSRLAKPELNSKYFGVNQDIAAFTQFVRNWLTDNHRWRSPLFVAGESYGGIRGAGLSNSLFDAGIALNGFVSISGTNNFMTLDGMRGNDVTFTSFLPSMASCAWYHHKLSARFKDVESVFKESQAWVDKEYAPALLRGDSLSAAEKSHIADKLSEYLGLSKKYCLNSNLRVSEWAFFRELLRDESLSIGRYDGRLTGKEELRVGDGATSDPSSDATTAPFVSALNDYMDRDLGVHTDLSYLLFGNVYPWQERTGGYTETASQLRTVLAHNPHFRVLFACGYYDLACPINGTVYMINHMGLDEDAKSRIGLTYYPAGHMMYIEKSSRVKLHDDVKKFEAECLKAG